MKVRRIDFSPDEWLAGIAGMTAEEQGIYWLVCSLIYSSGGPIDENDERLIALAGCHGNRRRAIINRLVDRRKISRKGSEIDQKRARNELENARKRSENARENVAKRWKNNDVGAEVVILGRNANHQPSTTNHQIHPLTPSRGNGRSRRNGNADPFHLADLDEDELRRRFNDKTIAREEKNAIRQILFPGAPEPGF